MNMNSKKAMKKEWLIQLTDLMPSSWNSWMMSEQGVKEVGELFEQGYSPNNTKLIIIKKYGNGI